MHEIAMQLEVDDRVVVLLRRGDGGLTLTERGARFGVGLPDGGPARYPVGDRVAVAGRLPSGVAAVTVIDDAGTEHAATVQGELWMVVVDAFSEELVRYAGAGGELVGVVPDGEHLPITDARDTCPVCEVVRWVQVEDGGMTLITCGRCGFVVCGMGGPPVDTSWAPRRARSRKRGVKLSKAMVTGAPYRLYQAAGTAARVVGQTGQGAELESIELIDAADTLTVISSAPARRDPLQERLSWVRHRETDDLVYSTPASAVHSATERRTVGRLALAAVPEKRTFAVDGEPVVFEFLDTGAGWGARCELDGVEVVITARSVDPATVALQRVAL